MLMATLLTTCSAFTAAGIKLPTDLPTLEITANDKLGTNENNIGLKKGEVVKDFAPLTIDHKPIRFSSLLNNSNIMVVFYRGGWCPYCNVQVRQLSVAADAFTQRDFYLC
jgi:thiol-disulfide isomerase/thioredoxin